MNRVYKLTISEYQSRRSFIRMLVDFSVHGINPLNERDKWSSLLGVSRELYDDFTSFRLSMPLEWILGRFLFTHLLDDSISAISSYYGEVLTTKNFKTFLGETIEETETDKALLGILTSWVRSYPKKNIQFKDIYVSTRIDKTSLRRSLNYLISQIIIDEEKTDLFKINPDFLNNIRSQNRLLFDGKKQDNRKDWDCFICHAFEDKEEFVRQLAEELIKQGYRVWYDEFSLRMGDSLRRSIDQGLAKSRYGIVVISPNFLNKEWPQKELDGLVSREIDGTKVILPVWHNIDFQEVQKYSPTLADRVASKSSSGIDSVIRDIKKVIT